MAIMPENRFIGDFARYYDKAEAQAFEPEVLNPAVACLAELAAGGPVLEFAIGTGRVAVPLAQHGLDITGIEISADMLAELRAKPGAASIKSIEGDMATTQVDGDFSLVYLVYNTITNLTTQEEQVACFANAARHLRPGGRFVIENGIPKIPQLKPGIQGVPFAMSDSYIGLDEYLDMTHKQLMRSRHLLRKKDGTFRESGSPFRYVWPAELDLMARLAGMKLENRWADWQKSPYESQSPKAISVWVKEG